MADAGTLIAQVRREIGPTEVRITEHPYLETVSSGRATIEGLRALPGHQYHVMQSMVRSCERLVERFGDTENGPFFRRRLEGAKAAAEELLDFAKALGMSEAELLRFEPRPGGFTYATYFAWLAEQGTAAEVAMVSLVNLPVWGAACGRLSRGLYAFYGLGPRDTRVLNRFAAMPTSSDEMERIIQDGLDQGVAPEALSRAARLVEEYEKEFWDALSEVDEDYRCWPPAAQAAQFAPAAHVA